MPIDVIHETLVPLTNAGAHQFFRHPKTGKPAHKSKMFRLVQRGARAINGDRIRLEVIKSPCGFQTSLESIQRFAEALTDPDRPATTPTRGTRRKQIDAAERELSAAGFEIGGK